MYMTCNHYLERILGWERSKLGFLGENGLKPEVFYFKTDERSFKRAINEL